MTAKRALLLGTLTVGTLDILDAFIFFGLRSGAQPMRILQTIASGVLGRDSYQGGLATAALGLFLHYVIAFGIVTTYYLVSRRVAALTRRPFLYGVMYGVAVYVVMNWIVIPLSAVPGGGNPPPIVLLNGILIHMFGVGLPSALFARHSRC